MAEKDEKADSKKNRKSGVMTALLEEMNKVYDNLELGMHELLAKSTGKVVHYKNREIISWYGSFNTEYTCMIISGDVRSLEFLYPTLIMDEDFKELKGYLGHYKKPGFIVGVSYDDEVLGKMTVPIRGLLSKLHLVIKYLEDIDVGFSRLESKSIEDILRPLTEGPLAALKKDTNPLRESIKDMKVHIADTDSWKDYRSTWEQLDQRLKIFSLSDFYELSEKIKIALTERYKTRTTEKLNVLDIQICNNFMNELTAVLDGYDAKYSAIVK